MRIHFIGIGGIGVSALARYYLSMGHKVSGSDLVCSEITQALEKKGAKLLFGRHNTKNLPKKVDSVIYSPAVRQDNPELKEARKRKIKIQSYPEALGELTKKYLTIAVSGTHGKSTTTAMLGLVLEKAGLDPTVIVGTKLKEFGDSNFRMGKSKYLVLEADEHTASFLNYWPKIIVLTAIEADHLDYYKNLDNVLHAFEKYVRHLPENGILIANKDDKEVYRMANNLKRVTGFKVIYYSLRQKVARKIKKTLKIPGVYNISNGLAAFTAARTYGVSDTVILRALSEYKGSWRRFELKKLKMNGKQIILVSDYGHHPTEVRVTLRAAREKWPKKKIWCVFQPHQYQRTQFFFNDFVKVLREAPIDKLILADIYDVAGREDKKIKKAVSAKKLAEKIKSQKVIYVSSFEAIINYLKQNVRNMDVLIIMGAGDIYYKMQNANFPEAISARCYGASKM